MPKIRSTDKSNNPISLRISEGLKNSSNSSNKVVIQVTVPRLYEAGATIYCLVHYFNLPVQMLMLERHSASSHPVATLWF